MKIKDLFKNALSNFIKNKKNIIMLLLISLSCSTVLIAVTFNQSISNYWKSSVKKLVDYRTFFTYYDFDVYEENEAIQKLKLYDHIESVAPYSSYLITMIAQDYIEDGKNSAFFLEGTNSNPVNIAIGDNLNRYKPTDKVMICADKFYPYQGETVYDYSQKNFKDFSKRIGEDIPLSFIDSKETEYYKLIGVYNASLNQTDGNLCYTSFENLTSLNLKYQAELYEQKDAHFPVLTVIDNVDNINQTLVEMQKDGFYTSGSVLSVNTKVGDKIINITLITAIIMSVLSLAISLLLSLKNQETKKREFGILKVLGYTNKDISKIQYGESIILFISSFILSIVISKVTIYLFKTYFIVNISIFNGIQFPISILSLLICFVYCLLMPLLLTYILNKKIKKANPIDMIRG